MTKRNIALALSFLIIFAVSLFSCSGGAQTGDGGKSEESLPIVAAGATDYVIVRSDLYNSDNAIVQAAVTLRNALKSVTGTDISIKTDWDGKDDNTARKEILVGDTNRQESIDAIASLGEDQYIIKVCGDGTKIVITGKTESTTTAAVQYFLATYAGYNSESEFTAKPDLSLTIGLSDLHSDTGNTGDQIVPGTDAETALIFQDAGTVADGKRTLGRTDVLIYKLSGTAGKSYLLTFDIEGEYLVTVSSDNETYYRLFAYTDDGYGTPRGNYSADLTSYFASSGTVYVRVTDYHPLDESSPIIYALSFTNTDNKTLG
jgi:hypothetical protein